MAQAPLQIAVVDDFPEDRAAIRRALRIGLERHFVCHEATTGEEALHLCRPAQADGTLALDVLLLDLNLPDLNGIEILAQLKGDLAILPLPVVILTGTLRESEARAALAAGAQDFIAKAQITPENITRVVLNAIERFRLVRELHVSEALFRGTFEQAAVGIAHTALDGHWLRVNQRFCDIIGYTNKELLNTTYQAISHPDDIADDIKATQQILQGEIQSAALHKRYFHKSGRLVCAKRTVSLVRNAQGLPDYFVSVIEDITALKEAEQRLIESEERYHRVIEDQTELICRYGLDLRLNFVNQAYATAVGKSPADLIGQSMLDYVPLAYQADFRAHLAALSASQPVIIAEAPTQLAGGNIRWLQWTDRLIFDAAGRPSKYQGVGHDVTDRKQAEAAERAQRRLAEALRDSLAALTSSLDVNTVMAQILASAATVVPSEGGSIILIEGDLGHVAYLRGFPPAAEAFFRDYRFPINTLLATGLDSKVGAYLVPDIQERPEWIVLPPTTWIRSSIGIPIELHDTVIGLLVLDSATPHHFQPADIEKLQAFAHYAGLALENADHVTQLEAKVTARTAELLAAKEAGEAILNNSRDGIVLVDPELHIQQSNRAFQQLFGCEEHQYLGRSLLEVVDNDDQARVAQVLHAVLSTQVGTEIELGATHHDGSRFAAEFSIGPLKTEGLVCTIRDITERKRADDALRASEARYRLLAENISDMVWRLNTEGEYLYVSPSSRILWGYTPEELIGRSGFTYIHPEDLPLGQQVVMRARQKQGPYIPIALRFRHKDGHYIWLEISGRTIFNEADGAPREFIATLRDVTARKRTDAALRAQRDFLQLVVDNVPNLIMVKDDIGRFQLVNESTAQLYGVTPPAMIGKTDADFNSNVKEIAFFQQKDQQTLASGQSIFIAEETVQSRYYQTSKIPLKNDVGDYDHLLVVASDITERKMAEEALQQALHKEKELGELKSRFISMASHEFRTPLTVIRTTADTLLAYRQKLPPEQIDKRLGKIQEQVLYLRDIIEDVLQLTRLQAGRAEFNAVKLDLDTLCRTVIDELRSQLEGAARLQYHCEGNLQEIYLDKKMMRQIINNLLSNAIKYSPGDKPVLATLSYCNDALVFQVSDEGIGIPAADLNHIFEPFHRAANVGNISGTGLGLVIAKESVELQGGTLLVTSQEGVGTTFTVNILLHGKKEETHEQNFSN